MIPIEELFGIDFALIQAPMAGCQASALAIAVSNAGGLGSLPCGLLGDAMLEVELGHIADSTRRPYNVNFFCHTPPLEDPEQMARWRLLLRPFYEEFGIDPATVVAAQVRAPFSDAVADIVERFRPPVVSFHFGLPSPALLGRVRGWGAKVVGCATTIAEAQWLRGKGVDAIVAQGSEAGGHRGIFLDTDLSTQVGTFALLPRMVRALDVPVIAAGGLAGPDGVRAAFELGANAVQLGTAYLLCPESTTSSVHRRALKSERADHTALTNLFSGGPARGITNRLMEAFGPLSADVPPYPLSSAALAPLRAAAEASGRDDFSPLWCGQNRSGCKEIPAAALTQELASAIPTAGR